MTKFTFEMDTVITEQTTVEAESYKKAREILLVGDCEWEEIKSRGGDWELVSKSLPKSKLNPVPFFQRLVNAYYNPVTGDNIKVNADGIPITYENKDELSAEDIESSESGQ
jgi:hypothetical protein